MERGAYQDMSGHLKCCRHFKVKQVQPMWRSRAMTLDRPCSDPLQGNSAQVATANTATRICAAEAVSRS